MNSPAAISTLETESGARADQILLRGRGLNKRFGGVHAVRDISLDIPQGGVFAIIGPNGAGKSTLLNLMSGHYQPDSGTMTFAGVDPIAVHDIQQIVSRTSERGSDWRARSKRSGCSTVYPRSTMFLPVSTSITTFRSGNTWCKDLHSGVITRNASSGPGACWHSSD